jgi:hypothetical protein
MHFCVLRPLCGAAARSCPPCVVAGTSGLARRAAVASSTYYVVVLKSVKPSPSASPVSLDRADGHCSSMSALRRGSRLALDGQTPVSMARPGKSLFSPTSGQTPAGVLDLQPREFATPAEDEDDLTPRSTEDGAWSPEREPVAEARASYHTRFAAMLGMRLRAPGAAHGLCGGLWRSVCSKSSTCRRHSDVRRAPPPGRRGHGGG